MNQSNVGDLLLKIIMCGLPAFQSGKPLSPFWQTDPYSACEYFLHVHCVDAKKSFF